MKNEDVIAGALFDFAGYLTTLPQSMPVGASENASPMVDALEAFAAKRGLSLSDPNIDGWWRRFDPNA